MSHQSYSYSTVLARILIFCQKLHKKLEFFLWIITNHNINVKLTKQTSNDNKKTCLHAPMFFSCFSLFLWWQFSVQTKADPVPTSSGVHHTAESVTNLDWLKRVCVGSPKFLKCREFPTFFCQVTLHRVTRRFFGFASMTRCALTRIVTLVPSSDCSVSVKNVLTVQEKQ